MPPNEASSLEREWALLRNARVTFEREVAAFRRTAHLNAAYRNDRLVKTGELRDVNTEARDTGAMALSPQKVPARQAGEKTTLSEHMHLSGIVDKMEKASVDELHDYRRAIPTLEMGPRYA